MIKKFLRCSLYVGYLIAKSPDILHLVYGGGWIAQENNKSHSLSTRIGLGCTYRPTKFPVFVSLSSDYIYAKALFNNLNVTQSDGSMVKYSINQPLNRLLISLGLGFYINRVD